MRRRPAFVREPSTLSIARRAAIGQGKFDPTMNLEIAKYSVSARTIVFLTLTVLSSGSIFGATFASYLYLSLSEFSKVAVALALSTVIGAALQLGAAYSLPAAAHCDGGTRNRLFIRLIILSAFGGVVCFGLVSGFYVSDYLTMAALLGALKGLQIICDNYLRSRSAILALSGLNAALNTAFFLLITALALTGNLSGNLFLYCMMATKLSFVVATLLIAPPNDLHSEEKLSSLLATGLQGTGAVVLIFGLGNFDVIVLSFLSIESAQFIAMRHFGYGLFLTLVQDSAIPLLLAHLLRRSVLSNFGLAAIGLGLSLLVGILAIALGVGLSALPGKTSLPISSALLIFATLSSHTLAVFSFNAAYVTGCIGSEFLRFSLAFLTGIFLIALAASSSIAATIFIASIGNAVVAIAALSVFADGRKKLNTETASSPRLKKQPRSF